MVVHIEEREEEHPDQKQQQDESKKVVKSTWRDLALAFARKLNFASPEDLQPSASTSSSSTSASGSGRRPEQLSNGASRLDRVEDHSNQTYTREPEDDTMFLSPQGHSLALPSASSSNSSTTVMSDGTRRRRGPMFINEVCCSAIPKSCYAFTGRKSSLID